MLTFPEPDRSFSTSPWGLQMQPLLSKRHISPRGGKERWGREEGLKFSWKTASELCGSCSTAKLLPTLPHMESQQLMWFEVLLNARVFPTTAYLVPRHSTRHGNPAHRGRCVSDDSGESFKPPEWKVRMGILHGWCWSRRKHCLWSRWD